MSSLKYLSIDKDTARSEYVPYYFIRALSGRQYYEDNCKRNRVKPVIATPQIVPDKTLITYFSTYE
jgi:hypothetical protein